MMPLPQHIFVPGAVRDTDMYAPVQIFNTFMFGGGPILVSLASFTCYTALGYPLTAAVAFPALALFNLLRFPVRCWLKFHVARCAWTSPAAGLRSRVAVFSKL